MGDGFCNDETNKQDCNYDGGDCCVNMKKDNCSACACLGNGVITSPEFPQNYANGLDVTWLIQVPRGQYIEIAFISFDVNHNSSCK